MKTRMRISSRQSGWVIAYAVGMLMSFSGLIWAANPGPDNPLPPQPSKCKPEDSSVDSFNWYLNIGHSRFVAAEDALGNFRYSVVTGQQLGSLPPGIDDAMRIFYGSGSRNRLKMVVSIEKPEISAAVLEPSALSVTEGSVSEILRSGDTVRQVVTENMFTIVEDQTVGFRVKAYDISRKSSTKTSGYYTLVGVGEPVYETHFTTDDGLPYDDTLQIISIDHSGSSPRVEYKTFTTNTLADTIIEKSYLGSWNGSASTVSIGAQVEEVIATFSSRGNRPYDYTLVKETKRVDVATTTGGTGVEYGTTLKTISRTLDQFVDMSLGGAGGDSSYKRLIKHVDGHGTPEPRETRYEWYSDPTNEHIHGRVKLVTNSDKSWKYHEYTDSPFASSATETVYEGWKDQIYSAGILASAKKTVMLILNTGYTKTVSIAGQTVSEERQSFVPVSGGGKILKIEKKIGTEWLSEQTEFYAQDGIALLAGRPKWKQNMDGTYTRYTYDNISGDLQITEQTGAGDPGSITEGTQLVKVYNAWQEQISAEVSDVASGLILTSWVAESVDAVGRPTKIIYNANINDYEELEYICCGLGRRRNRDASVYTYSYDFFKRPINSIYYHDEGDTSPIGSSVSYVGLLISEYRGGVLTKASGFKINGELENLFKADTDGDGDPEMTASTYSYPNTGGKILTKINPDGGSEISEFYVDGQLKSVAGTATAPVAYDYGTHSDNGGGLTTTKSLSPTEWVKTYVDSLRRVYKAQYPLSSNVSPGVDVAQSFYAPSANAGSRGKPATQTDQDGTVVSFSYDSEGRLATQVQAITDTTSLVTNYEYDVVNDSGENGIGVSERTQVSLNGVIKETSLQSGDGYRNKKIVAGIGATTTINTVSDASGNSLSTTTNQDGTKNVSTILGNRVYQKTKIGVNNGVISSITYGYDALDRVASIADSRVGTTIYSDYTAAGKARTITDSGSRVTTYRFDKMGRLLEVDAPNTIGSTNEILNNISRKSYYPTGNIQASWGGQENPVYYNYDNQGRKILMRTFQALAGDVEPDSATPGYAETTWNYDSGRGFLINKRDASSIGSDYTYTAAGKIKNRTWARGVVTTHSYTNGLLTNTSYSDETPDVTITYDSMGRQESVTQANNSRIQYSYDAITFAVKTETISYDLDRNGAYEFVRVLDRKSLDSAGREVGWEIKNGSSVENEVTYGYHLDSGRLETVDGGELGVFSYGYQINSPDLISTVTGPSHTVTNQWEANRNVLDLKENRVATTLISKHDYLVNDLAQRINVSSSGLAFSGISSWDWIYNGVGEVVKADSSSGHDRVYDYDGVGNRVKTANSLTLPSTNNYIVNTLNQYTSVEGVTPGYDDDGNATAYPVPNDQNNNTYIEWDAENRISLVENSSLTAFPTIYSYDSKGRMIGRLDSITGGWTYYIYDGWNRIAEYGYTFALSRTYAWGLDVTGSLHETGGVGGLLAVSHEDETGDPVFYPTYDGNGNVSEYLNSSGSIVAHFEYDPFGNVVVDTDAAGKYRFRFSTRTQDSVTGLYYYGYRFYDPLTGRWLSRDPISEFPSKSLRFVHLNHEVYLGCRNDFINLIDKLGLEGVPCANPRGVDECCKAAKDQLASQGITEVGGVTVCCDGARMACSFYALPDDNRGKNDRTEEIIRKCITVHEIYHRDRPEVTDLPKCPCECGLVFPMMNNKTAEKEECEANKLTVDCLENGLKRCDGLASAGDIQFCKDEVQSKKEAAQMNVDRNCDR